MPFIADDLGAWLVSLLADAGRKKLTRLVLGDEQERALRQAATAAVWHVAVELRPESSKRAEDLAMVVSQVFDVPLPDVSSTVRATLLEALQAGIIRQIAVLDDASLTGTGQSSAEVLGLSFTMLAEKLISHLVREVLIRGSRGGPLEPLAGQLNHDMTHLQGQRLEEMIGKLALEVRETITRQDASKLPHGWLAVDAGAVRTGDGLRWVADMPAEALPLGYIDQVRDLAPKELLDRDDELADLMDFCAGEQPYAWWQAEPWAGKSALAAWLVLHPPPGITVASFFITSRWAGQADSDAYTTELIQQLAAICGLPEPSANTPASREKARRYLLSAAIERCAERGEHLLLVIDGLDEDQAARSGQASLPSIASLLPLHPPPALRVLVTSRLHPGIPSGVPMHHPLRTCIPRLLTPSPHAYELAELAKEELRQRCASIDSRVADLLGILAASGGGLTRAELAHLTGIPGWMLQELFISSFGRTLHARTARDAEKVYLFAHETLADEAIRLFADDLPGYRQRIHEWAADYRAQGWPTDTPRYLLAPYGSLLSVIGDVNRLVTLAVDPARHDRMLTSEYNDSSAFAEILAARQALNLTDRPDLATLSKLAISEWRLRTRNPAIPVDLPAAWARLGETERAVLVASTITDPASRDEALRGVVKALASTDPGRAEVSARTIKNPVTQALALASIAIAVAAADLDRAEQAARAITDHSAQAFALARIAAVMARSDPDRAERTARTVTEDKAEALAAVAAAVARSDPERARRLAAEAEQAARAQTGFERNSALSAVAVALTATNPHHAERIASAIDSSFQQDITLHHIAVSLAATNPSRAERIANTIAEPDWQAHALASIAAAVAATDSARLERLTEEAMTLIDSAAEADLDYSVSRAWTEIIEVLAPAEPDRAEEIVYGILDPYWRASGLAYISAAVSASSSERGRRLAIDAEETARTIISPASQAQAQAHIAAVLTQNDPGHARRLAVSAEQIARAIDPRVHDRALRLVTTILAPVYPAKAEQAAHAISNSEEQSEALANIAIAIAIAAADLHHAEGIADLIANPSAHAKAMAGMAAAVAATDVDQAERIARISTDPYWQARALAGIVARLTGSPDRIRMLLLAIDAEQLACSVTDPSCRARALAEIAAAVAADSPDRARRLALDAEQAARATPDFSSRAHALANIASALAASDNVRAHRLALSAEQAARKVSFPDRQAKALINVATALAATDTHHARVVLFTVLSAEYVFETLPALARLEANAVPEICEHALLCLGNGRSDMLVD